MEAPPKLAWRDGAALHRVDGAERGSIEAHQSRKRGIERIDRIIKAAHGAQQSLVAMREA
jgi:hypothetical protein